MQRRKSKALVASDVTLQLDGSLHQKKAHQKLLAEASFGSSILAFIVLISMYAPLIWVARQTLYQKYVEPLPSNASLDKFSEGRAMKHVWHLAHEIGIRQEGSVGLLQAAEYLKSNLEYLRTKASSNLRLDIDQSFVNGSFTFKFLMRHLAVAYANHTNIAIRVSGAHSREDAAAILVNGHFDGPFGSPGAADCASCVASMLEVLRYIVDTDWVPSAPIIFLFNGAEEVYLLGAHGFITTHKWRHSIGAVINIEASGACGPDVVVQSGPGSWPSEIYAKWAVTPMANSIAQDIFPHIPGDTDYRIFSKDFGDIPGLDILFILEGYIYHTAYDRPENIVVGSIQARGENLISLLRGFSASNKLVTRNESSLRGAAEQGSSLRPVYFDFFGKFIVYYSGSVAIILHMLPLCIIAFVPFIPSVGSAGFESVTSRILAIAEGAVLQLSGCMLAVIFPVVLAMMQLSVSNTAMTWFAEPSIAVLAYSPAAVAGLLLPRLPGLRGVIPSIMHVSQDSTKVEVQLWANHWGAVTLYALESAMISMIGLTTGYFTFWWAMSMILAWILYRAVHRITAGSVLSIVGYVLPTVIPVCYSIIFSGVLVQFVAEKMGMSGSPPGYLGFMLSDIVIATVVGVAVVMCLAPLMPIMAQWLAKPELLRMLLYLSIGIAALSSRRFPYSVSAPKRLLLQHTFITSGNNVVDSRYDFATTDSNSMSFILRNAQSSLQNLHSSIHVSEENPTSTFLAMYPVSYLFSYSSTVHVKTGDIKVRLPALPKLRLLNSEHRESTGYRRLYLELELGSLQEVWASVMNITGPLVSWSFSAQQLPEPEYVKGGPPSYICRLTGRSSEENWKFWLEANGLSPLKIELAILDQQLDEDTQRVSQGFPSWVAIIAGSSYMSSYSF